MGRNNEAAATPAEPTAEQLAAQLAADAGTAEPTQGEQTDALAASAAAEAAPAGTRYRVKSSRFHGFQPGDEVTLENATPEQLQHLEAL